jgi:hypothetical protein
MKLYHYRCKNTLGVWGQSPHKLASQVIYHENATGWLTFSDSDIKLGWWCFGGTAYFSTKGYGKTSS